MPPDLVAALKPDYVAPLVLLLGSEGFKETGQVYEVGAGWVAAVRRQRSQGHVFSTANLTPEAVRAGWAAVGDFSQNAAYPTSPGDSTAVIMGTLSKAKL